jgi:hypothetical protein
VSKIADYKCDMENCKERVKDANSWFTLWRDDQEQFHIIPGILDFTELPRVSRESKHACGIEHANIFSSRYLTNRVLSEKM